MKTAIAALALWVIPVLGVGCVPPDAKPPAFETAPPRALPTSAPASTVGESTGATDDAAGPSCVVHCEGAQMASVKGGSIAVADADSKSKAELENANAVLAEKNDALVRCYRPRLRAAPGTEGTVTFDVLIGSDGHVLKIDPHGGEKLGTVDECMMKVIQESVFAPPHGGGTLTIRVPFTLRAQSPDEST